MRTFSRRILALAIYVCILAPLSMADVEDIITILYNDGRNPEEIRVAKIEEGSEELYLRANDVARIFKATQFWNATARKVVLGIGNTRFVLTIETRVVVMDGEIVMLKNPVCYQDGFVMIPMEFILNIASHRTPLSFSWDRASMTLRIQGVGYNIRSISFSTSGSKSIATITLSEPLLYHMDSNTPGLVRLKMYDGRINTGGFLIKERHGLINSVRAEQTDRDAYIYFDIKKYTTRLRVEKEDNPPRIRLVLEKGKLPEIPEPEFAGKKRIEVFDEASRESRHLKVEKVVIDPGHGGKDFGKVGRNGALEKDVNMALAVAIAKDLRRTLGLEVILTREDDRLLSLTRRTEIANESSADLFISIHCNSWFSEKIGGFEAYFLSPALTEWDKAVAMVENRAGEETGDKYKENSDIDFILWDMVQNEFISESSYFAELIQKEMSERLDIRNRGVKQANFTVLQGARMPAVLIETAFLSNPREEKLLQGSSFQERIAEGITEAVHNFKKRYQFSLVR